MFFKELTLSQFNITAPVAPPVGWLNTVPAAEILPLANMAVNDQLLKLTKLTQKAKSC